MATLSRAVSETATSVATFALNSLPANGDTYMLWAQGQTYTVAQNGVVIGSYFDPASTLTSGNPGFGFSTTGILSNSQLSNFQTGDSSAAGAYFG